MHEYGQRNVATRARQHATKFKIAEVRADHQHAAPARHGLIEQFCAMHLHAIELEQPAPQEHLVEYRFCKGSKVPQYPEPAGIHGGEPANTTEIR